MNLHFVSLNINFRIYFQTIYILCLSLCSQALSVVQVYRNDDMVGLLCTHSMFGLRFQLQDNGMQLAENGNGKQQKQGCIASKARVLSNMH